MYIPYTCCIVTCSQTTCSGATRTVICPWEIDLSSSEELSLINDISKVKTHLTIAYCLHNMQSMIHTKYGQNNKDRDTPSLYHIMIMMHAIVVVISLLATRVVASSSSNDDKHEQAKFDLWLRGEFSFDTTNGLLQAQAPLRHGSVRDVRRRTARDMKLGGSNNKNGWDSILNIRGGGSELIEEDAHVDIDKQLIELGIKFGQPFIDAIEQVSHYIYICTAY